MQSNHFRWAAMAFTLAAACGAQSAFAGEPAPRQGMTTGSASSFATLPSDEVWRDYVSGYQESGSTLRRVPIGSRLYENATVTPASGFGPIDDTGVRVVYYATLTGPQQNPVAQAQYALTNLNSYRLTHRAEYLDIAVKNAQRILDRKIVSSGAWYFPYDFPFTPLGDTTKPMVPQWFSGMAQGQALSTFTRLYEATGAVKWKEAADRTFVSLLQAPAGSAPFASYVDSSSRLWLEEYPHYPASASENVLNGHLFASFGVHDYWMMTGGNPLAAKILRGSLKTIEGTLMQGFRRENWASTYSLGHPNYFDYSYHTVHQDEMIAAWAITHNPFWIASAMTFRADFPKRNVKGSVIVTPQTTKAYEVDAWSRITATKAISISTSSAYVFDARWRVKNGPVMLHITNGDLAGLWVEEDPGKAYALGATEVHTYNPQPMLTFTGGKNYTGVALDASGRVISTKTAWIRSGSTAPVGSSGWVQGQQAYYVTAGVYAGQWVAAEDSLVVGSYD